MDELVLVHAGKIMHLVLDRSGLPWESPFGPHEYDEIARETFDSDICSLVIGLAEGYWKKWLMKSKMEMIGVVKSAEYERYIRNFLGHFFELNAEDDMVNVLTMIMYIIESSFQLYFRNVTDALEVGVRVLAEVLQGKSRNQEEMGDRFNRLYATAFEIMCDPKYCNFDTFRRDP